MPSTFQIGCSILTMTSIPDAVTAAKKSEYRGYTYQILAVAYAIPVLGAVLAIAKRLHLYLFYNDKIDRTGLDSSGISHSQQFTLVKGICNNLKNMTSEEYNKCCVKDELEMPDAWEGIWILRRNYNSEQDSLVFTELNNGKVFEGRKIKLTEEQHIIIHTIIREFRRP